MTAPETETPTLVLGEGEGEGRTVRVQYLEVVRRLDYLGALAAHYVLGLGICGDEGCEGCDSPVQLYPDGWVVVRDGRSLLLAEDIGDAWRLVEAMHRMGNERPLPFVAELELQWRPDGDDGFWTARFDDGEWWFGTAPVALCLAALAATGHPVRLELGAGEEG